MSLITGTHHVSLKCKDVETFEKAVAFYTEILEMPILRRWGEGSGMGIMISTGNSVLEMFASGAVSEETGSVNHFALATEHVTECLERVRKAGYQVTVETKDVCIPSEPPYPAQIGFCIGPVGEEIEFFHVK